MGFRWRAVSGVVITFSILVSHSVVAQQVRAPRNLDELIKAVPKLPVAQTALTVTTKEAFTRNNEHGVTINCTSEGYRKVQELDAIVALNPNVDVTWPGALVQGKSLESGSLTPIGLRRAPGTLTLTSLTLDAPNHAHAGPIYSRIVESPSQATVTEATQAMLRAGVKGSTPAQISFQLSEAHSVEQGLLDVGLSGRYLGASASAQFNSAFSQSKSNFFVKYVQAYYSVTFSAPSSPGSVFRNVRVRDAQPYIGSGNPPAYISSVTYGRMLIMMVTSESNSSEVRAALEFAVRAPAGGIEGSITAAQRSVLNKSEIRALVLGGGADTAVKVLTGDVVGGLTKFLADGANFSEKSPGAPISYQARYLVDNDVARLSFATDFRVPNCVTPHYKPGGSVIVENFQFHDTADDDEDLSFSMTIELLRRDSSVLDRVSVNRRDVYVLEPHRDGGRSSSFFGGTSVRTAEPIFGIRITVSVRTEDGDGKRWGDDVKTFSAPFQDRYSYEGGGDGVWRLTFRLE